MGQAEQFVRAVSPWLVHIAEGCAEVTVLYGLIRTMIQFVATAIQDPNGDIPRTRTRLTLGRSLALALEFLLAADILNSLTAPSLQNLAILGGVALIRTGLNYFLSLDLEREDRDQPSPASRAAIPSVQVRAERSRQ